MYLKVKRIVPVVALSMMAFVAFGQSPKLNWKVFPAGENPDGAKISTPGYRFADAINAVVPGTVFYSYVEAGKEKDPDYAENIYQVDKSKYNQIKSFGDY